MYWLCEAHQQHERSQGQDDPRQLKAVQRLPEHHHADRSQEQDHGDRVEDTNGGQLQVPHHEHPAECGRSVKGESEIKPPRPERLLSRAGEFEEVVAQHANHTEGDRDENRERVFVHRRLAT